MALLTCAGALPVLSVGAAVGRVAAALMAAALAAAMLALVLVGGRMTGGDATVRTVWTALSAVSALIAVLVAFDGEIASPMLLAMAVVVALAARNDTTTRSVALSFAAVGAVLYLAYAPPSSLLEATPAGRPDAVSTVVASVLLIACAIALARTFPQQKPAAWAAAASVTVYGVTTFTVTAGMLVGGPDGGFFAGHMAATICWIALAATLFGYAARLARAERSVAIGGGLALVAAAMAKLFLFDLGTLDGIFRVGVFIVVGLILLGMGAGYARLLDRQDQQVDVTADTR